MYLMYDHSPIQCAIICAIIDFASNLKLVLGKSYEMVPKIETRNAYQGGGGLPVL